ncbi:MAG: carboxypeptidase-like regulatory domain-containing protein, partial [Muribaculaceae bacterium]|nr:carboxypeptidase-like regulatory domain-containing protein [Muribaculaceae bacterium]
MKLINKIFMVICMLVAALAATAQTATVTGVVLDAEGPLPGASVYVVGTQNAVVTDFDGIFTLSNVDAAKAVLRVSYVGYEDKEVKLDGRTSDIEIYMEANNTMLEEMVVIGYG